MKKSVKILIIAFIISTIGYIMDGDPKEPLMISRFGEFLLMLSAAFILIYLGLFAYNVIRKIIKTA